MMNSVIKAQWVQALRSKKYKQGRDGLRNNHNEYCCLGVLCDVVDPFAWTAPAFDVNKWWVHGTPADMAFPSQRVMDLAGLDVDEEITIDGITTGLAAHNDRYCHTFEQIADAIEEQL